MSGSLLDRGKIRADMSALVAFARHEPEADCCDRYSYFDSLNMVQQYQLRIARFGDGPLLDFSLGDPQTSLVLDTLRHAPEFNDSIELNPVAPENIGPATDRFGAGRALLKEYSPEVAEVVDDLIAWVIMFSKDGYDCGSMWNVLGAIWMSPGEAWTSLDYAENLLHESVHQAMLLGDMVHGLFAAPSEALAHEDALVISSIREVKRPYDFAFHAATVSVSLIDFHERVGDGERARELAEPLIRSLGELAERRRFLSPYGNRILADMIRCTASLPMLAALEA